MQTKENAIVKIKKLLRLSKSPYQEEANAALKKARGLMLQYHIDELALDVEESAKVECESMIVDECMINIFYVIARNNRCDMYHSYKYIDGKRKHSIEIVGFRFDIECVKVMCDYAKYCFDSGLREIRRKIRSHEPVVINGVVYESKSDSTCGLKNAYLKGFRIGLIEAFKKQNEEDKFYLMVITPQEVKDHMTSLNLKGHYRGNSRNNYGYNGALAFESGRANGRDVATRRKIDCSCEA